MSQTAWVVYEPHDYQRADIIGVFMQRADATRTQNIEEQRRKSEGNINVNVKMTEVPLE